MGDLRDWSPEPNGAALEERPLSSSSSVPSNQTAIGAGYWQRAEEATQEIISQVQPTVVSEERRKAVIDYVQRLIRNYLGCEVFPFGSVPLKTYLPDGDIDLTAFGGLNVEEALANDVCSVLEKEDQNRAAEFVVKDAQLIRAEVKLVKCLVQNIVVDISFNQLGGLCTLCFLEQVDRLIGKDHLFKRSIILIKAWCYYESRILGAHHGLISTYALETLVLYIFHLFHSTLNGPLAVLYKFLDYFSKFDWDNYCISLNGPVRVSSLPEVVVETPENGGGDLLLSSEFLKDCAEQFSVPSRGFETNSRTFPPKHLNIVDPLKENNNLGRSVSKGNFYRIRSAFTYGARKLGRILSQPEESITDELQKFFSNTLDRHGSGQRPDVQDPVPLSRHNGIGSTSTFSGTELCQEDQTTYEPESVNSSSITENSRFDHEAQFCGGVGKMKISSDCRTVNEPHCSRDGTAVSENRLSGDAKDLATSKISTLVTSNSTSKSSSPSGEESTSLSSKAYHGPHLYFNSSMMVNGEMRNGNAEWKQPVNSGSAEKNLSSGILPAPCKETNLILLDCQEEKQLDVNHDVLSPAGSKHHPPLMGMAAWSSEDFSYGYSGYQALTRTAGSPKATNTLSDLSGDYESHLISLNHGRWWYEHALNASYSPMSPQLVSQFQGKNSWEVIQRSLPFRRNVVPQMNANGVVPRPLFYPMNPPILPGANFGMEDMPKPRGTGTYFPNTNHYRDRPLNMRGRNQAPIRSPRSNGRVMTPPETNFPERSSRELALAPVQIHVHQGGAKAAHSDPYHSSSPEKKAQLNANGSVHMLERVVEFGSVGHLPYGPPPLESSRQPNAGSSLGQNSSASVPSPRTPKPKSALGADQDRIASYHLKDEDFPPLSA
ncbi:PAP/OAS1 substrate-binding domain superfamily [Melia azedarach]|uniref:PAP/OAS1 substrate-binding domain superfamily n=2 Tax=Melia azedarach TaxID=155640 RepID=A0ACC1X0Q1_MELAZ|nr:PAP/OAS1 substrate-binding domain superfamily [Melia azedarach]KAJ4704270.1 PAP/OAS1 substrate-binding domain superfamily [Melia azedarach]